MENVYSRAEVGGLRGKKDGTGSGAGIAKRV